MLKPKRKPSAAALKRRLANQIPEEITMDGELTKAIEQVHGLVGWLTVQSSCTDSRGVMLSLDRLRCPVAVELQL